MIVIIEDEVFSSSGIPSLQLVGVLKLGFEGRHRVQTEPPFGADGASTIHGWLERQDRQLRDEVELAFELGLEEDAHGIPCDHRIRIAHIDEPEWDVSPPRLPLKIALPLLEEPLHLILENRRNDWAFLESVSFEPWTTKLRQARSSKFLKPTHGGGLPEIKTHVEEVGEDTAQRLRHWVLFDSDAREPGKPSKDSEKLRQACLERGVSHHQLKRRASENYLPQQALHGWAYQASSNQRNSRRKTAEAFSGMEPLQRHHFNMKKGFDGDRRHGKAISSFFGDWPRRPELASGFGSSITQLFLDAEIDNSWLVRDGQKDETMSLIQAIFRAL